MEKIRKISPSNIDPEHPTEEQINALLDLLKEKNRKHDELMKELKSYHYIPSEIRLTIADSIYLYKKYYKKIDVIIKTLPILISIAFQIIKLLNLLRGTKNG